MTCTNQSTTQLPAGATQVSFDSAGAACDAWHFAGQGDRFATAAGRPVVVMAHGLAGTKDSGLAPFATALAAAGLDVFVFDYRGFGASGGHPRQTVSVSGQQEDYRAAMTAAGKQPGVDADRIVLWGVSLAGGHVLAAAVGREDVVAVVSLTPLVDGRAAGRHALASHPKSALAKSTLAGVRSKVAGVRGKAPVMMAVVGKSGDLAALTLDGLSEDYLALAGPTWRNEIDATVGLELGSHRPITWAKKITCPLLVQIADFDRSAPPQSAAKAAFKGRAEVRHYPCDHFDVWPGKDWFDATVAHQVSFLTRHLSPITEEN